MEIEVVVAEDHHQHYAEEIVAVIEAAAKARGTGIAKREPEYIRKKILEGKAVIALVDKHFAGFCYIETWDHNRYVANSGLIVSPDFRKLGLARKIKQRAFELSRNRYPEAKIFGITTSLAVMKINSELGYQPVTFSELTQDEVFWKGCKSCPNYDVLSRNDRKLCLCTGMLYDPMKEKKQPKTPEQEAELLSTRWERYKEHLRKRRSNKVLARIRENLFGPQGKKDNIRGSKSKLSPHAQIRRFFSSTISTNV